MVNGKIRIFAKDGRDIVINKQHIVFMFVMKQESEDGDFKKDYHVLEIILTRGTLYFHSDQNSLDCEDYLENSILWSIHNQWANSE